MIPILIIDGASTGPTEVAGHSELAAELIDACEEVLGSGRCVEKTSVPPSAEAFATAKIEWQGRGRVRLSIVAEKSRGRTRQRLEFRGEDPPSERYRAVGYSVATLALAYEPAAAASAAPPASTFDLGGGVQQSQSGELPQLGSYLELRGAREGTSFEFFAHGAVVRGLRTVGDAIVTSTLADVGVAWELVSNDSAWGMDVGAFVGPRCTVMHTQSERASGLTWGGGGALHLSWRFARSWAASAEARAQGWRNPTTLIAPSGRGLEDEILSLPAWTTSVALGLEYRFHLKSQ